MKIVVPGVAGVVLLASAVPAAGFNVAPGISQKAQTLPLGVAASRLAAEKEGPAHASAAVVAGAALGAFAAATLRPNRQRQSRQQLPKFLRVQPVSLDEKRFPVLSRRPPLGTFPNLPPSVHPGVVTGKALQDLLEHAKQNGYAIPAVNCVSSSGVNACLEAARKMDAPVIIQFSSGGAQFYAGKGLDNTKYHAFIAGAISGAYHVRAMAEQYGIPVILHTDHCAKKLLPWMDGMIEADERYFELHGEPLFSSHMLDLSEEPLHENIEICQKYMERMAKINCGLEMELGITGGEEDGVNNEDAKPEDLYSKPEEIWQVYEELSKIDNAVFTVAAAFGNVHGVYQAGNVKLTPQILGNAQKFIEQKIGKPGEKPVKFVFHGGSGSDLADIRASLDFGVVKMNIDTDTQWAYWNGIRSFESKYRPYLQSQIGNPDGSEKPNKKYYDPRACLRSAEEETVKRLQQSFEDLKCVNILGLGPPDNPTNVMGPSNNDMKMRPGMGGLPA